MFQNTRGQVIICGHSKGKRSHAPHRTGAQDQTLRDRVSTVSTFWIGRATGKQLVRSGRTYRRSDGDCLDGAWGSGKSVFLKCWVGAHRLENEGSAQTVYFDAFRHDYLDDPLLGLMSVIADRFEAADERPQALERAKKAVAVLSKPAARLILAAATAGVSELTGVIGDAVAHGSAREVEERLNDGLETAKRPQITDGSLPAGLGRPDAGRRRPAAPPCDRHRRT